MKIVEKDINALQEYENNPRDNEKAIEAVAASIQEFGFKVPVIIDGGGVIVAGHTRVKAARVLGLQAVPCIIADDLTPEQVKAFRLADNKTSELSDWDFEKLEAELAELDSLEIDMSEFGFDESIIDTFSKEFELPTDDKPQVRTITLTLSEEQYQICESVIDYFKDKIQHSFGGQNARSNALFEGVYLWAEQNSLL